MTGPRPSPAARSTPRCRAAASSPGVALAGGSTVIGSAVVRASAASAAPARSVLVVLSLRGAADGLSLVVPHADPVYYEAVRSWRSRGPAAGPRRLFGLHPALAPLVPLWQSGRLAAVHATGLPHATAPTSPRWRSSRTPTPDRPSAWAG